MVVSTQSECVPASFITTPAIPNGSLAVPYSYTFYLAGDAPFTLNVISKPSWMTITLDGSLITLTGTPDASGTDIPVEFSVVNCDEANTLSFSDTIDISEDPVSAILMFTQYSAGIFQFDLSAPIPSTAITIDQATVQGYMGVICGGPVNRIDHINLAAPVVIAAGDDIGMSPGVSSLPCSIGSYKKVNSIRIVGIGTVSNGNVVTIGGTSVTIQINNTCNGYDC